MKLAISLMFIGLIYIIIQLAMTGFWVASFFTGATPPTNDPQFGLAGVIILALGLYRFYKEKK